MARELLGQARLHVVDDRDAEPPPEQHRGERRLLDGVDAGVAVVRIEALDQPRHQRHVEDHLGEREADRHLPYPKGIGSAEVADARDVERLADRVGQQVDVIGELGERLQELAHRDRRSTVFVERLRSDNQHARSRQKNSFVSIS
jgi:hypothetical protein